MFDRLCSMLQTPEGSLCSCVYLLALWAWEGDQSAVCEQARKHKLHDQTMQTPAEPCTT